MAYFVQNTILTKHGLNRLDEYMYEYTETRDEAGALTSAPKELPPFNFSKVVISNVVGPLDINTTQLANEIYTVPVESVVQNGVKLATLGKGLKPCTHCVPRVSGQLKGKALKGKDFSGAKLRFFPMDFP